MGLEVTGLTKIVVGFSKPDDAKSIKGILMRNGFQVISVCTTGSQILSTCEDLNGGILVCGYRFSDMMYEELRECLPASMEMLLIASPGRVISPAPQGIVCLPMPLKVHDLISTLEMMVSSQIRRKKKMRLQPKERSQGERFLIDRAKALLMERNNMTETEAHRYLQKCSMNSGTNLVETAQMVMSLINI